jgi:hypothetical protein
MKALNLSIYTGSNDGHKVTMTAEFENHDEAVRFHETVAKACRDSSPPSGQSWAAGQLVRLTGRP